MSEHYQNVPRTDNLDLPILSEVDDPSEIENEWGVALDDLLVRRLDELLGDGEGELTLSSITVEEAEIGGDGPITEIDAAVLDEDGRLTGSNDGAEVAGNSGLSGIVSVTEYGAEGDGSTNDTDAVQDAADDAEGRQLYFPSGEYIVEDIEISDRTIVLGDGPDSSIVRLPDDAATDTVVFDVGSGQQFTGFQHIGVDGNRDRTDTDFDHLGEGIENDSEYQWYENVVVRNTLGEGIDIDGARYVLGRDIVIEDCSGNGWHCSDPELEDATLVGGYITNCAHERETEDSRHGGIAYRGNRLSASNVTIRNCATAIHLGDAEYIQLDNISAHSTNGRALQIRDGSFEVYASNCHFDGTADPAVAVWHDGGGTFAFSNCLFEKDDNGGSGFEILDEADVTLVGCHARGGTNGVRVRDSDAIIMIHGGYFEGGSRGIRVQRGHAHVFGTHHGSPLVLETGNNVILGNRLEDGIEYNGTVEEHNEIGFNTTTQTS